MAKYNETIKTSQFTYKDGVLTINEGSEGWYDFRESVFDIRDSDPDAFEQLTKETRKVIIPSSWGDIGEETFDEFEDSQITCIDMMKATSLNEICVSGLSELKVAVIPKQISGLSNIDFNDCPKLHELHIYNLDEDIAAITHDEDKRLTIYASQVSSDIDSFDDGFLSDVGILYVPANKVKDLEKLRDEYDDVLDIRPLPDGYSFPKEALSEPWQQTENNHSSKPKQQYELMDFNPFDQGEEKYKYVVQVNDAGEDKDAVIKAVTEICNCTKQKAEQFVDELDDLLSDDEVCSVESESSAQNIKQQLANAGASISIREREYEISLDNPGNNRLLLVEAIMEIRNCDEKEAKELIDRADRNMLDTGINTVETLKEALSIKAQIEATGAKASISTSSCVIDEDDDDNDELEEETPSFDLDQVYGGPQYYCVLEGKAFGPVTIRQFANMVRFGIVDKNTMVWKEGMANWALAQTVADLQTVL
jgi:ribosomal protein L7/L12